MYTHYILYFHLPISIPPPTTSDYPPTIADVNENDVQDIFAGYGIYKFQNLPTNQKENYAKRTTKTAQKYYLCNKNSPLKPKTLCSSQL